MTLTIQLDPVTESALASRATESGVAPDQLAREILTHALGAVRASKPSLAEVDAFLRELRDLSSNAVGLCDPNFTRDTIYQDHD